MFEDTHSHLSATAHRAAQFPVLGIAANMPKMPLTPLSFCIMLCYITCLNSTDMTQTR